MTTTDAAVCDECKKEKATTFTATGRFCFTCGTAPPKEVTLWANGSGGLWVNSIGHNREVKYVRADLAAKWETRVAGLEAAIREEIQRCSRTAEGLESGNTQARWLNVVERLELALEHA